MTIAVSFAEPASSAASAEALMKALNRQIISAELSDALGRKVCDVEIDRVHFPGSRPIQIHYRYRTARALGFTPVIGELIGDAVDAHRSNELQRLAKPSRRQVAPEDDGAIVALPAAGVVLRRPGLDARLPGLSLLHSASFAAGTLARIFEVSPSTCKVNVKLAAHRLGKRAVLSASVETRRGETRRVFVRLRPTISNIGEELYWKHKRMAARLSRTSTVAVPKPIHFDKPLGAAFVSALPGIAFELDAQAATQGASLAGRALFEWRSLVSDSDRSWTPCDEIRGLDVWAKHITNFLPRMAPEFRRVFEIVASDLYCLPTIRPEGCHRDFHEGQLLLNGSRCGILDFDTWCVADPALDIGNFAAHLRFSGLNTRRDTASVENAFISAASEDVSERFAARVKIWKRAALLRLAAIYAFTSTPRTVIRKLLAEAAS